MNTENHIPLEEEPNGLGSPEHCIFCESATRYWHAETNTPVCVSCSKKHSALELSGKESLIMNRYEIDQRGGCIAVIDTTKKDEWHQGLHADDDHVVQFWMGFKCPASDQWRVSDGDVKAAKESCRELNKEFRGTES